MNVLFTQCDCGVCFLSTGIKPSCISANNYCGGVLSTGTKPSIKMAAGPYNYSYIFKYIIIGDMGVGKSCLLHQFTEKKCKWFCQCFVLLLGKV